MHHVCHIHTMQSRNCLVPSRGSCERRSTHSNTYAHAAEQTAPTSNGDPALPQVKEKTARRLPFPYDVPWSADTGGRPDTDKTARRPTTDPPTAPTHHAEDEDQLHAEHPRVEVLSVCALAVLSACMGVCL
mmetsp:Transcript_35307/g.87732  ORF Transcript_35307/g.87732 Transcript_35307/m.87732 type:complete len:131 (+) Transcript_35307:39-431(+)